MTTFLIFGLLLFLLLGIPIGYSMLLTSICYLLMKGDVPLIAVAQRVVAGTDQYLLLAIPFFFLAAELMNSGGIMQQLVRVATAMVGHFRGGLGHVSVVANILLSGISGSAAADAAGLGRLQVEMMKKGGYGASFAAALGAAAATIGPVIPPSIPFVVYGGIAGVSVGALFLAGIIPGLLMGVFLMAAVWIIAKRRGYPMQPWAGFRHLAREVVHAAPILVLPVIILGGILFGAFTPTEAAIVAGVYAFVLGKFVLRTLLWADLYPALVKVGYDTANLMFIIAASAIYTWILARENVPQDLSAAMLSVSREPWIVLLLINIVLLILGTALEPIVVLVLVVPIFDPLIRELGIDPVHFGVIVTLNLMIGLLTPPMGSVIFIMMAVAKVSMEELMRECWPFMLALTVLLVIITYVPWLTLVVPNLYYGTRMSRATGSPRSSPCRDRAPTCAGSAAAFGRSPSEAAGLPAEGAAVVMDGLIAANLRGIDLHGVSRIPMYLTRLRRGVVTRSLPSPSGRWRGPRPWSTATTGWGSCRPPRHGRGDRPGRGQRHRARRGSPQHALRHGGPLCAAGDRRRIPGAGLHQRLAGPPGLGRALGLPRRQPPGRRCPRRKLDALPARHGDDRDRTRQDQACRHARRADPGRSGARRRGSPDARREDGVEGVCLPFGGMKGAALAMLMDLLAGVLTGAAHGGRVKSLYFDHSEPQNVGHLFVAMRRDLFVMAEEFDARMADFVARAKASPKAAGVDEILIPGEPEERVATIRRGTGIPITVDIVQELAAEAESAGVQLPAASIVPLDLAP